MGTPHADFDRWDREQQAREDYDIALWDYCTTSNIRDALAYMMAKCQITQADLFRLAVHGVCCGEKLQRSAASDDPDEWVYLNKMAEMIDGEMARRFDIYRKAP